MKQSSLSWSGVGQKHFKHMKRILLSLTLVGMVACTLGGFAQTTSPAGDTPAAAASAAPAKDAAPPSAAPEATPAAQSPAPAAAQTTDNSAAQPAAPASVAQAPAAAAPAAAQGTDNTAAQPTAPTAAASNPPATAAPAAAQVADNTAAQPTAPAGEAPAPATAATNSPTATAPAGEAPAPATAATNSPATATPATAPVADNTAAQPAAPASAAAAPAPDAATPGSLAQSNAVIPLIVMDEVPLTDAIRNLARQAGLNYLLDPRVAFGAIGPDGKPAAQPSVSIRWENVTAEQALNALLNNYNLHLVQDLKSGIARVTVKDPAALPPLVTKIIQLQYTSPSNVLNSVKALLMDKRSKAMPDTRTSQLVVVATEDEMAAVDELVTRLDTMTKEVLIEARILETTVNPATQKGVDWSGTLTSQHFTMGNNGYSRASGGTALGSPIENGASPLPAGLLSTPGLLMNASQGSFFNPAQAFLNADGVSALLSFLNTYTDVKEISCPRTVTLDTEKAVVEVGELYPIVNVTAGTSQTTGGSQITYSNLTIRLEVTPRISANDYVNLQVVPSITKLGPLVATTIASQNNSVNSFLTRNLNTHVMIPSGNTLVMGGLIQDQINSANNKVPLLGDIPVLGYLFRWDQKDRTKTDIILFITPTIVKDGDFQPTKTDYLKTPVPKSDYLEGDWSAWDSGQPKDWSNKAAKPDYQDPDAMSK